VVNNAPSFMTNPQNYTESAINEQSQIPPADLFNIKKQNEFADV
jgi:hypothetical protein